MRSTYLPNAILVSCCALLGFALAVQIESISLSKLAAVPIALIAGIAIVRYPFIGLVGLVFMSQVDAFVVMFLSGLPISATKILALLTLAGVILDYRRRSFARFGQSTPLVVKFVFLLIIATLISVVLAHNHAFALATLKQFASFVLLCYLIVVLANTTMRLEVLLLAVMASTLLCSLVIIYDWSFGENLFAAERELKFGRPVPGFRSSGASLNAAPTVASMLLCGVSLAAIYCLRTPRWRAFTCAVVIIGSLGILFNSTRSTSFIYILMYAWIVFKFRDSRRFPLLLLGPFLLTVIVLTFMPGDHWSRMSELFAGEDNTIGRRVSYHIVGFDLFLRYPIFGAGLGNFPLYFIDMDYRWIPGTFVGGDGMKDLHNQYLQTAAERGIVALFCFLGLLVAALKSLNQVRIEAATQEIRVAAEAIQFSLVGFMIQIGFKPGPSKYLWILLGFVIALQFINQAANRGFAKTKNKSQVDTVDDHGMSVRSSSEV